MTTIVSTENHAASATLDGDELDELLDLYLCKVGHTPIEVDSGNPQFLADETLWQLVKLELDEITGLGKNGSLHLAVTWITECVVHASAATMNEQPREAIATIAALVSKLRRQLRDVIADYAARNDAA
jgi:hypothetical protein